MRTSTRLLVDLIRSLAEQGMTRQQAADEAKMSYTSIVKIALDNDINFKRQVQADSPEKQQRAVDMRHRYENGETLESIARRYGVTRERVRQIMRDRFGTTGRRGCSYRDYMRILKQHWPRIEEVTEIAPSVLVEHVKTEAPQ